MGKGMSRQDKNTAQHYDKGHFPHDFINLLLFLKNVKIKHQAHMKSSQEKSRHSNPAMQFEKPGFFPAFAAQGGHDGENHHTVGSYAKN